MAISRQRPIRMRYLPASFVGLCMAVPGLASPSTSAIKDVSVVDVEAGVLRRHRTVLIEGDRITRIGPSQTISVPVDTTVVDGEGLFLVPGLIDAHFHYINPQTFGPMMIAHGVTLVRDTGAPNFEITPWMHISPDLQVIIDPGNNDNDVAIVYGMRMQMTF